MAKRSRGSPEPSETRSHSPEPDLPTHPEYVHEVLNRYRRSLSQDIDTLRKRRVSAEHNLPLYPQFSTIDDYLRSFLLVHQTSTKLTPEVITSVDRHADIVRFGTILGVNTVPIDLLFNRLISGDLSDARKWEAECDLAFQELDLAIDRAREQWLSNRSCIVSPDSPPVCSVVLRGEGQPVIVNGIEKRPLTKARYQVVSALVKVFPGRLTKGQLEETCGKADAYKILRSLRTVDSDWLAVLLFPESYGQGLGLAAKK